ncbi:MAG: sterol desaturase family protein [Myxococcales bacterium]|nr:sterol desaturase family protein [Myxococcales bacterium]
METVTVSFLFIVGALGWTLAEYLLHDFAGHRAKGRNHFSREHLRHHAEFEYFASPWEKARAATSAAVVLSALTMPWLGVARGAAFVAGFVASYLFYEWVHRRVHTHPPRGAWGRLIRKHHFAHHFRHPHANHGVTSPVWDRVFGTYVATDGVVRVPRKHAMRWLVDPETGAVWEAFASDYEVVGRG